MTNPTLAEQLKVRLAAAKAVNTLSRASTEAESDAQHEARLMGDDSAWDAWGGTRKDILPR